MTQEEFYAHPGWRWCTAQGARDQVLLIGLETTFREKLEWLEEAETLSLNFQASREARERADAANQESRNAGKSNLEIKKPERSG